MLLLALFYNTSFPAVASEEEGTVKRGKGGGGSPPHVELWKCASHPGREGGTESKFKHTVVPNFFPEKKRGISFKGPYHIVKKIPSRKVDGMKALSYVRGRKTGLGTSSGKKEERKRKKGLLKSPIGQIGHSFRRSNQNTQLKNKL